MTQSKTKLYELINNSSFPAVAIGDDNVELVELQPVAGGQQYNTRVTVRALTNHGYQGERAVFYKRIPLDVLGELTLDASDWSVPQDVLDTLNTQYRCFIDLEDLESFVLPDLSLGVADLVLTALPSSYAWLGALTLHLHSGEIPDCHGPLLPFPSLQNYNWWTTVDRVSGPMFANRYGGVLMLPDNNAFANALSDQGNFLWAEQFISTQYPDGIFIDSAAAYQDQWVVGLEIGNGDNWVFALAWLNPATGAVLRSLFFDTNPTDYEGVYQIAPVDGCVFVAAYDYPSNDVGETAVIFKVRLDGSVSWQKRLSAASIEGAMTEPALITARGDDNVYVLIQETTTNQWWVVKYAGKGVLMWQRQLADVQRAVNMHALGDGSLVLAVKNVVTGDTLVMRLDPATGAELWCKAIGGGFAVTDVATDASDQIYVMTEGILFKLDTDGTEVWSRSLELINTHSVTYNFDSMEVRDANVYLTLCDNETQTTVVFNLPTNGTGVGLFNIPDSQVLIGVNETDYLSDAAGVIANTAGALTETEADVTASEGDIQAVPLDPAPNWTTPRALTDAGPSLIAPPGTLPFHDSFSGTGVFNGKTAESGGWWRISSTGNISAHMQLLNGAAEMAPLPQAEQMSYVMDTPLMGVQDSVFAQLQFRVPSDPGTWINLNLIVGGNRQGGEVANLQMRYAYYQGDGSAVVSGQYYDELENYHSVFLFQNGDPELLVALAVDTTHTLRVELQANQYRWLLNGVLVGQTAASSWVPTDLRASVSLDTEAGSTRGVLLEDFVLDLQASTPNVSVATTTVETY